jgi:rhamnogalacturonan endolyase
MDRGVVAVKRGGSLARYGVKGNLISWRKFAQEPEDAQYKVYINGVLATTTGKTNYAPAALNDGDVVKVVPVFGGVDQESLSGTFTKQASNDMPCQFMSITFNESVASPDDYDCKYAWPIDLDGDGEFDWVVAQISRNELVNPSLVQAYLSDGTFLWSAKMSPNVYICKGQNDMVTVADMDCDGKGEVIIKSSDGTQFWNHSAGTYGKYANFSTSADTDGDGIVDYKWRMGSSDPRSDIYTGELIPPFYISIIDGMTGEEKECAELNYSEVTDGYDQYSRTNRSRYMTDNGGEEYAFMGGHFAITYDDGIHPMLMAECLDRLTTNAGSEYAGHHNYVFAFGYDWTSGTPTNFRHLYTWSRNDKSPWPAEFHQLRVCDVDGDGREEMLQGGFGVNTKKGMVFSAGIGHGDRFRVSDLDPDRPGLETYAVQQEDLLGQMIYDAATGEHLHDWYMTEIIDVGRG